MTDASEQCELCCFLMSHPHLLCVVFGIILLPIGIWTLITDSARYITGMIVSITGAVCFVPAIIYLVVKAYQEKNSRKQLSSTVF